MQIRIYQIKNNDKKFVSYQTALELGGINAADYRLAYSGDIVVEDMETALERIYAICNNKQPLGYNGHSLSVSDIIEVREWNSYFYVDDVGFQKLDGFKAELTDIDSFVRILICEPDRHPYVSEIPPENLRVMQNIVGGTLETLPYDDKIIAWCNDEGLIDNLPPNRIVSGNIIHGSFFFSTLRQKGCEQTMGSLDPEQADKLTERFFWNASLANMREGF